MNKLLAAAVLALAAVSAHAQLALDPDAMAKLKKQLQAQKAMAPAAVSRKDVEELSARLDRHGSDAATESGDEAKVFTHPGQPDRKGDFENKRVILVEKPLPSPTFTDPKTGLTYTETVMRKALVEIQAETQKYTNLPDGRARLESWTLVVSMDGRLMEAVKTVYVGKKAGADGVEADPKLSSQTRVKPSDPQALGLWKRVSREFIKFGNFVSA